MEQKKAIIMGASSGIGKELAKILSREGYIVGLAARRTDLLGGLQKELPNKSLIKQIDISKLEDAEMKFKEMISEMGGVDLVVKYTSPCRTSCILRASRRRDWSGQCIRFLCSSPVCPDCRHLLAAIY